MKKQDIATLIVIAIVSLIAAYMVMSSIFSQNKSASVEVSVVDRIKSSIDEPSETIFSEDSINPAVQVFIGVKKSDDSAEKREESANNGDIDK